MTTFFSGGIFQGILIMVGFSRQMVTFGCFVFLAMAGLNLQAVASAPAVGKSPAVKSPAVKKSDVTKKPIVLNKLQSLNKKKTVFIDLPQKRLILKATIVNRQTFLEMFCCQKMTKEHESILSVDAKAFVIHTGLLALGVKKGSPIKYRPKFQLPHGQELEMICHWTDKNGKKRSQNASEWVRYTVKRYFVVPMKKLPAGLKLPPKEKTNLGHDDHNGELFWFGHMTNKERDELLKLSADKTYQKAIKTFHQRSQKNRSPFLTWVFSGSYMTKDKTGQQHYQADRGNGRLICLANFPEAMMDVSTKSSATNSALLYETFTERIPPKGTTVLLELRPVFPKKK